MGKTKAIGIDLGSTVSEVAVVENGKSITIVNEEGSQTTPSVVSFKDGERKVGGSAKRQMVVNPKTTINLIKRFMGSTYDESYDARQHVQYDVVNKNNKPYVNVNGREHSAEEISSMILTKMKKIAEDYLGNEVTDAVITVPAFFSDAAKSATKTAGELAGLNVLRIIAEPTAAILSSNIDKVKGGKYMVTDFGGSTLDFSIADISDNVVEILASYGDVYLGGTDIDKVLTDYLVDELKNENGVDLRNDSMASSKISDNVSMALSRISEAAENAKIELSSSLSTEISIPYITVDKNNVPVHFNKSISRAKFEQLIKPIVDRVIECGKTALKNAKMSADELDGILLVGGSCRIPLIQEELIKNFGDKLIKSSNLDLAVAEGAAIQASILSGDTSSDVLLLDVVPLALGIETEGGVFTKIVEENTTIPCKKSQIFSTAVDNQTSVMLRVLNGVRPLAKDNKEIGIFVLDGIAPARRGVPQIEVTFDVSADSILTVTAIDKATNKEQHITIENKNTLSQDEIDRIKADAKEHEKEDEKAREELEKRNKCDSAIYQTEGSLETFKDNSALTEDDKKWFNEKIDVLKKMKEDNEYTNLDSVYDEVMKRWNEVSMRAYGNGGQNGNFNFDPNNPLFNAMFNNSGTNTSQKQAKNDDSDIEEV